MKVLIACEFSQVVIGGKFALLHFKALLMLWQNNGGRNGYIRNLYQDV